ncbi:hypothetical protein D3C73_960860 [compost metagenome]
MGIDLLIKDLQLRLLLLQIHGVFVMNQIVQTASHVIRRGHQYANLIIFVI